jgi:hypothetical protein
MIGKARLAPIKSITIPRLELTATVVSVHITEMFIRELEMPTDARFYWTDSTTVLKYIGNDKARYKIFIANRVQTIRDSTEPDEWHYVHSGWNPADAASRGVKMSSFVEGTTWMNAPTFFWRPKEEWPQIPIDVSTKVTDVPEIVPSNAIVTAECNDMIQRFTRFSSWKMLKKIIAWLLRLKVKHGLIQSNSSPCLIRSKFRITEPYPITVEEMETAEITILKIVQMDSFSAEIIVLI